MFSSLVNKTKSLVGISDICVDKKNDQSKTFPNLDCLVIESNSLEMDGTLSYESLQGTIFDCIRTIRDPEKPATLEDLQVVYEEGIKVSKIKGSSSYAVDLEFNPTVPHCTLATLIGLCLRIKVERSLVQTVKLNIRIKEGAHDTEDEINKQINDKERVAAAMENPNLREMVEKCIKEED